jgi:hypothetical protein
VETQGHGVGPPESATTSGAERADHHGPVHMAVSVRWVDVEPGSVRDASAHLAAEIVNNTNAEQSGELSLVGSGLGQELVERSLGAFTLAPAAREIVRVRADELPLQSQSSTAFAMLNVSISRSDGRRVRLAAEPLHYQFTNGYRALAFRSEEDVSSELQLDGLGNNPVPIGACSTSTPAWVRTAWQRTRCTIRRPPTRSSS